MGPRPTLAVLGALIVCGCAVGEVAAAPSSAPGARASGRTLWYEWFRSRPDLRPPKVRVRTAARNTAPGLIFLAAIPSPAHRGPMIVDDGGRLVWFKRLPEGIVPADFRAQTYRGRPVITWWQGTFNPGGFGCGVGVIADTSYRTIATVRPTNQGRYCPDLHEFKLTPRGTALMMFYRRARVAGRAVIDGIIEEVDVRTGRVLLRWSAAQHVALSESYVAPFKDRNRPWDFFHVNSVDADAQGNLLISARHTFAVYLINRRGQIIWRLGGKRSTFAIPPAARFAWQHDARFLPDGTISLFDNAAGSRVGIRLRRHSTGFVLAIDPVRRRVTAVRAYRHPRSLLAQSQGNLQALPNGNFLAGWGQVPRVSEFGPGGDLRFDLELGPDAGSYRAYRFPWSATPAEAPALRVARSGSVAVAYVSWNGSTQTARWQILTGNSTRRLRVAATVDRTGFQTAIRIRNPGRFVTARALGPAGNALRASAARIVPSE